MNPLMLFKIISVSCLVATVSSLSAFARHPRSLQQASSQLDARSVASPADVAARAAAQQAKLHYVEIDPSLKGNYKFGYDTGSGPAGQSFREETRLDDGTVKGAYGYVDANGKQRIVKYTAGKAGFVVEGDQEASGQQGQQQAAPASPQPAEPQRRPQPASLPQQAAAQPAFDEPQQQPQFTRAAPSVEDRARAEQQHAEQLRQHQLATQAALAQQQRLAQQLQIQQQQIIAAQRQPAQHQAQHQQSQQHQFAAPQQQQQHQQHQQFQQQPQPRHHAHIVDPQSGSFFSSSNEANLDQLLKSQLAQLQGARGGVPEQFLAHQRPALSAPQAVPAAFQHVAPQFPGAAHQVPDFGQQRAARQAPPVAPQFQHQAALSPQGALAALQQQQQQDAQMLAQLRAQQLARLQEQARSAPRAPRQQDQVSQFPAQAFASQSQPLPVHQRAPAPESFAGQTAPTVSAPAAAGQTAAAAAAAAVAPQPENFGPPVIDIRTLNYSIGQQTRV